SGRAKNDNAFSSHLEINRSRGPRLGQANDKTQIKEKERRGEQEAVDQVKRPADSRQKVSGILHTGAALNDRFREIADDRSEAKNQAKHRRMRPVQDRKMNGHQLEHAPAGEKRKNK